MEGIMEDLIKQGAAAFKAGDQKTARKLLTQAINQYPDSERAWGWMYNVCETDQERLICLKHMLRINPNNQKTRDTLQKLQGLFLENEQVPLLPQPVQTKNSIKITRPFSKKRLLLIGSLIVLLLLGISGVVFGGRLISPGSSDRFLPALEKTKATYTLIPLTKLSQPSQTPQLMPTNTRTPRPSFTPYPTNTAFIMPTWTATNKPPTQIPPTIAAQNPTATVQAITTNKNKSNPTPVSISTQQLVPSRTPRPSITISCGVDPAVIQVGSNTTLTIFAQLFVNGKAASTMAMVAEWKDSQGRNFHCTSQGGTCSGQSGYMTSRATSVIAISVNSADGQRISCQTTYKTP
jgi:hypothetical protein